MYEPQNILMVDGALAGDLNARTEMGPKTKTFQPRPETIQTRPFISGPRFDRVVGSHDHGESLRETCKILARLAFFS